MTDVREKAEALINRIKLLPNSSTISDLKADIDYRDLNVALRPSREEIADYLEKYNKWRRGGNDAMQAPKELGEYITYAIEELRKDAKV